METSPLEEEIIIIDLRRPPPGCTEHPLVRLKKAVKTLRKGEIIKVITDSRRIPVETIRVIARKKGLSVKIVAENPPVFEVLVGENI